MPPGTSRWPWSGTGCSRRKGHPGVRSGALVVLLAAGHDIQPRQAGASPQGAIRHARRPRRGPRACRLCPDNSRQVLRSENGGAAAGGSFAWPPRVPLLRARSGAVLRRRGLPLAPAPTSMRERCAKPCLGRWLRSTREVPAGGCPRDLEVAGPDLAVALAACGLRVQFGPAAVPEDCFRHAVAGVPLSPFLERKNDGYQVCAGFGQVVLVARRVL